MQLPTGAARPHYYLDLDLQVHVCIATIVDLLYFKVPCRNSYFSVTRSSTDPTLHITLTVVLLHYYYVCMMFIHEFSITRGK